MLLLKALQNRAVSRLWLGQVGSAIGDEIYRMAFIWLSVSYIGADTGYLAALQWFAVLSFGVLGGRLAERLSPYRTMISVDLLRAIITLTPVALYYFHRPSFVALVFSTVCLSGLGAFFEPALQTVLPIVARDSQTLKAANGLMSTTLRFARVAGPAIIGLLSALIATIHFFTLNALSYLFSTACVYSIRQRMPAVSETESEPLPRSHVLGSFLSSLKLLHTKPGTAKVLYAKTFSGGAWTLIYGLGMALLVHDLDANHVKAFGMVMGAYGIGNVAGALLLGNLERKNPDRLVYLGLIWLGGCFSLVALAKSYAWLLLLTGITGFGGPLNDVPFTDLVQNSFRVKDLHKIFRLRMICENFFSLVFMAVSPMLFHQFSVRSVMVASGLIIVLCGSFGLLDLRKQHIIKP